jgi:uncharacterized protein (TIGR03118 family)
MNTTPFRALFHGGPGSHAIVAATILVSAAIAFPCRAQESFTQHNLVSDIPGLADNLDPNLVNPWGITSTPASPFWVADNGQNVSTQYNTSGTPQALVVSIPSQAPTGTVFNSTPNFNSDLFLFATETGAIDGWRGGLGTTAEVLLDNSSQGSVYKGLAIATQASGTYLYAADFHNAAITVLPGTGAPALPGTFMDPTLPAGYAPFNIQNVNGSLLVTYALQDPAKHDEIAGPGFGFVDRYDLNGNLLGRLVSNGPLNAPWGLAIAPANFGLFSNDLLVGNFGDGRINAFNPLTGALVGTLLDESGNPLEIQGLWGLRVGNGGNGGDPNAVYFAAGIPGSGMIEDHGLFGSLMVVPDSGATLILLVFALAAMTCFARRRQTREAS